MGLSQRGLIDSTIGRALKQKMELYKRVNQQELRKWIKEGTIPATETFVNNPQRIFEEEKPRGLNLVLQVQHNPQLFYHEFFNSDSDCRIYRTCTPVEFGNLKVDILSLGELANQSYQ